uniref:RUN domain-containing protein n=1 Tax=Percolomonas cosmopolitus TaxID=63605 RepID=A0A7S1PF56_9EUKA
MSQQYSTLSSALVKQEASHIQFANTFMAELDNMKQTMEKMRKLCFQDYKREESAQWFQNWIHRVEQYKSSELWEKMLEEFDEIKRISERRKDLFLELKIAQDAWKLYETTREQFEIVQLLRDDFSEWHQQQMEESQSHHKSHSFSLDTLNTESENLLIGRISQFCSHSMSKELYILRTCFDKKTTLIDLRKQFFELADEKKLLLDKMEGCSVAARDDSLFETLQSFNHLIHQFQDLLAHLTSNIKMYLLDKNPSVQQFKSDVMECIVTLRDWCLFQETSLQVLREKDWAHIERTLERFQKQFLHTSAFAHLNQLYSRHCSLMRQINDELILQWKDFAEIEAFMSHNQDVLSKSDCSKVMHQWKQIQSSNFKHNLMQAFENQHVEQLESLLRLHAEYPSEDLDVINLIREAKSWLQSFHIVRKHLESAVQTQNLQDLKDAAVLSESMKDNLEISRLREQVLPLLSDLESNFEAISRLKSACAQHKAGEIRQAISTANQTNYGSELRQIIDNASELADTLETIQAYNESLREICQSRTSSVSKMSKLISKVEEYLNEKKDILTEEESSKTTILLRRTVRALEMRTLSEDLRHRLETALKEKDYANMHSALKEYRLREKDVQSPNLLNVVEECQVVQLKRDEAVMAKTHILISLQPAKLRQFRIDFSPFHKEVELKDFVREFGSKAFKRLRRTMDVSLKDQKISSIRSVLQDYETVANEKILSDHEAEYLAQQAEMAANFLKNVSARDAQLEDALLKGSVSALMQALADSETLSIVLRDKRSAARRMLSKMNDRDNILSILSEAKEKHDVDLLLLFVEKASQDALMTDEVQEANHLITEFTERKKLLNDIAEAVRNSDRRLIETRLLPQFQKRFRNLIAGSEETEEILEAQTLVKKQHEYLVDAHKLIKTGPNRSDIERFLEVHQTLLPQYDLDGIFMDWMKLFYVPDFVGQLQACMRVEDDLTIDKLVQEYKNVYEKHFSENSSHSELVRDCIQFSTRKKEAEQQLRIAMELRTFDELIPAIEKSKPFKSLSNIRIQAQRMLEGEMDFDRLSKLLQEATNHRNSHDIRIALATARDVNISDQTMNHALKALIDRAQNVVSEIEHEEKLRSRLSQILKQRDRIELFASDTLVEECAKYPHLHDLVHEANSLKERQRKSMEMMKSVVTTHRLIDIQDFLNENATTLPEYDLDDVCEQWMKHRIMLLCETISEAISQQNIDLLTQQLSEYEVLRENDWLQKFKFHKDDTLLDSVEAGKKFMRELEQAKEELERAMSLKSSSSERNAQMSIAIENARSFNSLTEEVNEMKLSLKQQSNADFVSASIQQAMKQRNLQALRIALRRGMSESLPETLSLLQEAALFLEKLEKQQKNLDKIKKALQKREVVALDKLIDSIRDVDEMGDNFHKLLSEVQEFKARHEDATEASHTLLNNPDALIDDLRDFMEGYSHYLSNKEIKRITTAWNAKIRDRHETFNKELHDKLMVKGGEAQWDRVQYWKTDVEEDEMSLVDSPATPTVLRKISVTSLQSPSSRLRRSGSESKSKPCLPSKLKNMHPHPLIEQLDTYIVFMLRRTTQSHYEKDDASGKFRVPPLDQYAVIAARCLSAILADRTKPIEGIRDRTPYDVLCSLISHHCKSLMEKFDSLTTVQIMREERPPDFFSISLILVYYLLCTEQLIETIDNLFEDEAAMTENYFEDAVLRTHINRVDLKYVLRKMQHFQFSQGFDTVLLQQEAIDELVSDSFHAPPHKQVRGSVKVILEHVGHNMAAFMKDKEDFSEEDVDISQIDSLIRKRLARSVFNFFSRGFNAGLFGTYHVTDFIESSYDSAPQGDMQSIKESLGKIDTLLKDFESTTGPLRARQDAKFLLWIVDGVNRKKLATWFSLLTKSNQVSSYYTSKSCIQNVEFCDFVEYQLRKLDRWDLRLSLKVEDLTMRELNGQ